jgi:hypothetical protein
MGPVAAVLDAIRAGDAGVTAVIEYLRSLGSRPAVWGAGATRLS